MALLENGKWRMENGEWKTENGKRKIENGKLKTGIVRRFRKLGTIQNNQKTPITLLSNRSIRIRGVIYSVRT